MPHSIPDTITIDGVTVTRVGAEPTNPDKFNTCMHRSENEIEESKRMCCGQRSLLKGFRCFELKIFPLSQNMCVNCAQYQAKI